VTRCCPPPNIDGFVPIVHQTGCGMSGTNEGYDTLMRTLKGYARNAQLRRHPSGGPGLRGDAGARSGGPGPPAPGWQFPLHDHSGRPGARGRPSTGAGRCCARWPRSRAQVARAPAPVSKLIIGLQCGGSDGYSGITANPALGHASDLLVRHGGHHDPVGNAGNLWRGTPADPPRRDPRGGEKLIERIRWWENYTAINGGEMDNNPSPGNKRGGLTTILEKSLGAVAKGGTAPLSGVYKFAEPITTPGFVYMDSPGYDPCSATGQIASGATMIVFTTGRGRSRATSPAPASSWRPTMRCISGWPRTWTSTAATSSTACPSRPRGRRSWKGSSPSRRASETLSEELGFGGAEFVPWQIGAVM
jgi:hypothetical protein